MTAESAQVRARFGTVADGHAARRLLAAGRRETVETRRVHDGRDGRRVRYREGELELGPFRPEKGGGHQWRPHSPAFRDGFRRARGSLSEEFAPESAIEEVPRPH
jgi:hypothetical protein